MKNCIIAQSGGPTAAINSSLYGVINENFKEKHFDHVYGSLNGITGILENRYLCLDEIASENEDFLERLYTTPAMYLGSCRFKLPLEEENSEIYDRIFSFFKEHDIDSFFYIGGNDSMDTVLKLSEYAKRHGLPIKVLGIPKTIDNDLMHTDHTPGFGSAAKYIATSMYEIAHDTMIYHVKSVTIAEIMGRDAGWLTASAALARDMKGAPPHLIYLPERDFSVPKFLNDVHSLLDVQDNVVVAVSEGIHDKDGNYLSSGVSTSDTFGHSQLSGAAKALELLVKEAFHVKVRSIEINILQRCAGHLSSKCDLDEAARLGACALKLAASGVSGRMMTVERVSDEPYSVEYSSYPIENIANGVRSVPKEFINEAGNDVTERMLTYLRPLIAGEPALKYKNGLPNYLPTDHLIYKAPEE